MCDDVDASHLFVDGEVLMPSGVIRQTKESRVLLCTTLLFKCRQDLTLALAAFRNTNNVKREIELHEHIF